MDGNNGRMMSRGVGSRMSVGIGILGASAGGFLGGRPSPSLLAYAPALPCAVPTPWEVPINALAVPS